MSIDVFGRVLKHKTSAGARGPTGKGSQRTPHGGFDISHKLLCNVATPQEDLDVVNLRSLKEIQHELESVHTVVKALNATFEQTLRKRKDLEGVNLLAFRNAELIGQLERYRYKSTPAPDVKQAVEWNKPHRATDPQSERICRNNENAPWWKSFTAPLDVSTLDVTWICVTLIRGKLTSWICPPTPK